MLISDEPLPSGSGMNASIFENPFNAQNNGINETNPPFTTLYVKFVCHRDFQQLMKPKECVKPDPEKVNKEKIKFSGYSFISTLIVYYQDIIKKLRTEELHWVTEMIWSNEDAAELEINQMGRSACGATSVINTLVCLTI